MSEKHFFLYEIKKELLEYFHVSKYVKKIELSKIDDTNKELQNVKIVIKDEYEQEKEINVRVKIMEKEYV